MIQYIYPLQEPKHSRNTCHCTVEDGLELLPVAHTQCAEAGQQGCMEIHADRAPHACIITAPVDPAKQFKALLPGISLRASGRIQEGQLGAPWRE